MLVFATHLHFKIKFLPEHPLSLTQREIILAECRSSQLPEAKFNNLAEATIAYSVVCTNLLLQTHTQKYIHIQKQNDI